MTRAMHILLAEDDVDDRDLFLEAISILDPAIVVSVVEDGEKLMTYLRDTAALPDCIFLDLNMPKKNGKVCLTQIREDHRIKHIPVIIYTTSFNSKDIDETFYQGATYFLRKPNSFKELKRLLNACIESSFQLSNHKRIKSDFILNVR